MLVQEPLRLREVVVKYRMGTNLVWKLMLQKVSLVMIGLFSVSCLATGETAELVNEDAEPANADADTVESDNAASLDLRDSSESQPADIDTADTPEAENSANRKAAAEQKKQQRLEVSITRQWTSRIIV